MKEKALFFALFVMISSVSFAKEHESSYKDEEKGAFFLSPCRVKDVQRPYVFFPSPKPTLELSSKSKKTPFASFDQFYQTSFQQQSYETSAKLPKIQVANTLSKNDPFQYTALQDLSLPKTKDPFPRWNLGIYFHKHFSNRLELLNCAFAEKQYLETPKKKLKLLSRENLVSFEVPSKPSISLYNGILREPFPIELHSPNRIRFLSLGTFSDSTLTLVGKSPFSLKTRYHPYVLKPSFFFTCKTHVKKFQEFYPKHCPSVACVKQTPFLPSTTYKSYALQIELSPTYIKSLKDIFPSCNPHSLVLDLTSSDINTSFRSLLSYTFSIDFQILAKTRQAKQPTTPNYKKSSLPLYRLSKEPAVLSIDQKLQTALLPKPKLYARNLHTIDGPKFFPLYHTITQDNLTIERRECLFYLENQMQAALIKPYLQRSIALLKTPNNSWKTPCNLKTYALSYENNLFDGLSTHQLFSNALTKKAKLKKAYRSLAIFAQATLPCIEASASQKQKQITFDKHLSSDGHTAFYTHTSRHLAYLKPTMPKLPRPKSADCEPLFAYHHKIDVGCLAYIEISHSPCLVYGKNLVDQSSISLFGALSFSNSFNTKDLTHRINRNIRLTYINLLDIPSLEELTTDSLTDEFMVNVKVLPKMTQEGYVFSVQLRPYAREGLYSLPHNVYFILDTSSSIEKHRFEIFKRALTQATRYLDKNAKFNIFTLGGQVDKLHPKDLRPSSRANVNVKKFLTKAKQHYFNNTKQLYDLIQSLQETAKDQHELTTVILLSDGKIFRNLRIHRNSIAGLLQQNRENFSLYTCCVSDRNNIGMLDWLAKLYHGEMLHVQTHAAFPRKLSLFVKRMHRPLAYDIHVASANSSDNVQFLHDPKVAEHLFADKTYTIYGTAKTLEDIQLVIQGRAGDKWLNITKNISLKSGVRGRGKLERETAYQKALLSLYDYIQSNSNEKLIEAKEVASEFDLILPIK